MVFDESGEHKRSLGGAPPVFPHAQVDAERLRIFRVLLAVLAPPAEENAHNIPLLHRICLSLVAESDAVRLACYVILDDRLDDLTPEFVAAACVDTLCIPRSDARMFWSLLQSHASAHYIIDDPDTPACLKRICPELAELVLFPFGANPMQGIGIVGAVQRGYFQQVGLDYFAAFTNLGDLILSVRTLALRDSLTGLPNRALFLDRLLQNCGDARRSERLLGVALLDLDGFKLVNDRYGHGAGDAILRQVSEILQSVIRPSDMLARLGGDEFAMFFEGISCSGEIEERCERLLAALHNAPAIMADGHLIRLTASLGVTVFPWDDGDPEALIRHADLALYAAKAAGRDQYRMHTTDLDEALRQSHLTRDMVKLALEEGRLVVHYQPIVMIDGGILGFEALLRLRYEDGCLLHPAEFLQALDFGNLARSVGCFVLEAVASQAEAWAFNPSRDGSGPVLRYSVNVSAHHLLSPFFIEDVRATLNRHPHLDPAALEIEITESAPLRDLLSVQKTLQACLDMGVRSALDDFGTGAASLTYLQKLPVHALKIDQSFVRNMAQDPKDYAIVSGVTHVGRLLGIDVIAEGAETLDDTRILKKLGCQYVQGYVVAHAMPAADIPVWVKKYTESLLTKTPSSKYVHKESS